MSKEQVNHPEHYGGKDNPYEAIKIIDAMGWGMDFCLGNALKYIVRAGKKDDNSTKQDLNKAIWYLEHAVELIETNDKAEIPTQEIEKINKNNSFYQECNDNLDSLSYSMAYIQKCNKYREDFIDFIKKRESEEPVFSLKENEVIKILESISDITPKFKDKIVEILKLEPNSSKLGVKMTDIFNK